VDFCIFNYCVTASCVKRIFAQSTARSRRPVLETLEMCLPMEELPTDQPQNNAEVAQFMLTKVLTIYNIILRENFVYFSVSLFRATTFYLVPHPPPTHTQETKSLYKHSSYNYVWKMYRTTRLPFHVYGCETWSFTLREERRLRAFEKRVLRRIFWT
jgi:hypothetical protein